jgi:hypothetical protein
MLPTTHIIVLNFSRKVSGMSADITGNGCHPEGPSYGQAENYSLASSLRSVIPDFSVPSLTYIIILGLAYQVSTPLVAQLCPGQVAHDASRADDGISCIPDGFSCFQRLDNVPS